MAVLSGACPWVWQGSAMGCWTTCRPHLGCTNWRSISVLWTTHGHRVSPLVSSSHVYLCPCCPLLTVRLGVCDQVGSPLRVITPVQCLLDILLLLLFVNVFHHQTLCPVVWCVQHQACISWVVSQVIGRICTNSNAWLDCNPNLLLGVPVIFPSHTQPADTSSAVTNVTRYHTVAHIMPGEQPENRLL